MNELKIYCKEPSLAPQRQHHMDAGLDLKANEFYQLNPHEVTKIHTGIHVEIPVNHVGLIFPRSGLATKEGLILANTVGVIDSDYRGEIICAMITRKSITISKYQRIAQLVIVPILIPQLWVTDSLEELSKTQRGEGGFGHTGQY